MFAKNVSFLMMMLCIWIAPSKGQADLSAMVVEAYSGKILASTKAKDKRPVASLTKIATAVVAIDWAKAQGIDIAKEMLTVPPSISIFPSSNPMDIQVGDRISLRDALYSALLGSDNIAAWAVAHHVGFKLIEKRRKGGDPIKVFVEEMNHLAEACGMKQTKFINPHGLDAKNVSGYSTAMDMALLSIYAMQQNAFNYIVRQTEREIELESQGIQRAFLVRNTHQLVGEQGVLGIKTGSTSAAGSCLATCMDREPLLRIKPDGTKGVTPRRLIVILLGVEDRFGMTRALLNSAWQDYDAWIQAGAPVQTKESDYLPLPKL